MTTQTLGLTIKQLRPGAYAKVCKVAPAGSLEVRKLSSGAIQFYWRVTLNGKARREVVGAYDSSAPPKSLSPSTKGFSAASAKRAAEELAIKHSNNIDIGGLEGLKRKEAQSRAAAERALNAFKLLTLGSLLSDYVDHLKALGRISHKEARSVFHLHVLEAWPEIASLPARDVTSEQIADMMRRVIGLGMGRTSNKLRSYLRAAFQAGKSAKSRASIPEKFKSYNIHQNPAAETEPDESANKPDRNPLRIDDLRLYWTLIKNITGLRGAVLRLHLLTGGQRIEQLVRLTTTDVQADRITLFDGKGRPGKPPREHVVPLTSAASQALNECQAEGHFALSTDGGITHLAGTTLSGWASKAAGESILGFKAKRIRSGVETLLAAEGISQETRGRLQSHGISGVQARHYDGHDYFNAKLSALKTLEDRIINITG